MSLRISSYRKSVSRALIRFKKVGEQSHVLVAKEISISEKSSQRMWRIVREGILYLISIYLLCSASTRYLRREARLRHRAGA